MKRVLYKTEQKTRARKKNTKKVLMHDLRDKKTECPSGLKFTVSVPTKKDRVSLNYPYLVSHPAVLQITYNHNHPIFHFAQLTQKLKKPSLECFLCISLARNKAIPGWRRRPEVYQNESNVSADDSESDSDSIKKPLKQVRWCFVMLLHYYDDSFTDLRMAWPKSQLLLCSSTRVFHHLCPQTSKASEPSTNSSCNSEISKV